MSWSERYPNPEHGAPHTPEEPVTMGARFACLCAFLLLLWMAFEAGRTIVMCLTPIG